MADSDGSGQGIERLAKANGLTYAEHADLPEEGALLTASGREAGAGASGALPGGIDGTLSHYTYTTTHTDSDNHTHTETHHVTIVITRIPESIGFAPFLGFNGRSSGLPLGGDVGEIKTVEVDDDKALDGCHLYAFKGTNDEWLRQLFSPSLIDWLARSPDDFGCSLADGLLVAARDGHLTDGGQLESLCTDTAHFAGAVRKESMEEVESGGAEAMAAKDTNKDHADYAKVLAAHPPSSPPEHATAAVGEYRGVVMRDARTWLRSLLFAAVIALIFNVFGIAIPILMIGAGSYSQLAIGEAVFVLIIFLFTFRSQVKGDAVALAREAFFRSYSETRHLKIEPPLSFAATHAEAKLPFEPDHVLSGPLPGGANGSLVWKGDGMKREDRIAVVAGAKGPVADAELQASPPGLKATELDAYAQRLGAQLAQPAQAAQPA